MAHDGEITDLLDAWRNGDARAESRPVNSAAGGLDREAVPGPNVPADLRQLEQHGPRRVLDRDQPVLRHKCSHNALDMERGDNRVRARDLFQFGHSHRLRHRRGLCKTSSPGHAQRSQHD